MIRVILGLIAGAAICILVAAWAQWMQLVGNEIAKI